MKRFFTFILVLMIMSLASANVYANKYAVHFSDKNDSPYSVNSPEDFLSERSIERRARHNVVTTTQDLPVNPSYVDALIDLGATVTHTSRWLNCAIVTCSSSVASQIEALPFVYEVVYVAPGSKQGETRFSDKLEKVSGIPADAVVERNDYSYGEGFNQINQINGIPVHQQGYAGEDMLVAVLDAGFNNVNNVPAFARLYDEDRLVFVQDVVNPGGNVYASNTSDHGTNVLSCMASYLPNQFIGTAPEASYALLRTEDSGSEYLVECYYWTIGAEIADSIGADLISTSLGYTVFDDSSMDFTHEQLDGTAVSSVGARVATQKGIFVSASAGNSNGDPLPYVSTPADAVESCAVGAVSASGSIASFSSLGPNGAGAPKPDICAMGVSSTVVTPSGYISYASGTSFACPITSGMITCIIEANPNIKPAELLQMINETGDRYPNSDIAYGYGIPDYAEVLEKVLNYSDLQIVRAVINDVDGNNDGKLNPGETASVDLIIRNKVNQVLSNVELSFSSSDPNVSIVSEPVFIGSMSPNQTRTVTNMFTITLSEDAIPNENVRIEAVINYNERSTNGVFDIMVYGYKLGYQGIAIVSDDNNDGILDPGETADMYVYINNTGNLAAYGVNGVITSNSDLVTINTSEKCFGDIDKNGVRFASFNITLNPEADPVSLALPFNLELTEINNPSKIINLEFAYQNLCNLVFNLHDSYGDGWNGANLIASFSDGSPSQSMYVPSNSGDATFTFPVANGVTVTLSWQSGNYDSECSFNVQYEDGTVIYTSGNLQQGVIYSFEMECTGNQPDICLAPTDLQAQINGSSVVLSWNEPQGGAPQRYKIYQNNLYVARTNETSTTIENLESGSYCYSIEAVYSNGCISERSNEVCVDIFSSSILGDANNSHDVNVADIFTVVDYILQHQPSPFIFTNADVDNNGVIDLLDVVGIINLIYNK